jgi:uncharacterized protein YcgI (DUF1989 family)
VHDVIGTRCDPYTNLLLKVTDPGGAENFKNRLERRAENPAETGREGVEKRATGRYVSRRK